MDTIWQLRVINYKDLAKKATLNAHNFKQYKIKCIFDVARKFEETELKSTHLNKLQAYRLVKLGCLENVTHRSVTQKLKVQICYYCDYILSQILHKE